MGVRAGAWLAYTPKPRETFDLAGDWSPSSDGLHFAALLSLLRPPSERDDGLFFRRRPWLKIDRDPPSPLTRRTKVATSAACWSTAAGSLPTNPYMGGTSDFDVTPFVRRSQENEFILVTVECVVRDVAIHFYEEGEYP